MNLYISIHGEHLAQPLQTNIKRFEIAVTSLKSYNGNFNATKKNNRFNFTVPINCDDLSVIFILPGANDTESLDDGIRRNFIRDVFSQKKTIQIIQAKFFNLK